MSVLTGLQAVDAPEALQQRLGGLLDRGSVKALAGAGGAGEQQVHHIASADALVGATHAVAKLEGVVAQAFTERMTLMIQSVIKVGAP